MKLTLGTGTRPGPINNATLQQYQAGSISKQGNKIVLVAKHKRSKDGPAILGFDKELQGYMDTWLTKIRPKWAKPGVNSLFVKQNGEPYRKGTIGRRLTTFFDKAEVKKGTRVAHTSVRKFVSSNTNTHDPKELEKVAKVMAHSRKTQERRYVRTNLTELGDHVLGVIKNVTSLNPNDGQKPSVSKEVQDADEAEKAADGGAVERAEEGPIEGTVGEAEEVAAQTHAAEDSPSKTVSGHVERGLTAKQKEEIKKMFDINIRTKQKMEAKKVRNLICTNKYLARPASFPSSLKKVVNHLNYLINQQKNTLPKQAPVQHEEKVDDWLHDFKDASTRSSGRRQEWSEEDNETIINNFGHFERMPTTSTIRAVFNSDDDLTAILERESWKRCYNKMKNYFRTR